MARCSVLIGFNDEGGMRKSRFLTTIKVDAEEGRQLAKIALRKIQTGGSKQPEVVIQTTLIKNGACSVS